MKPYLFAAALYLTFSALVEAPAYAARTYTIRPRDSLEQIGRKVGSSVEDLLTCNPGIKPLKLQVGQKIQLSRQYKIRPNDSLWDIAQREGTTIAEIASYNRIKPAETIHPGDVLELPCREPRKQPTVRRAEDHDEQYTPPTPKKRKKVVKAKRMCFPSKLCLEIVTDPNLIGPGKEFYDPNQSGNPLLRVPKAALYDRVSRYFALAEFARVGTPSLAQTKYLQTFKGDRYNTYIRLDPDLLRKLDNLRKNAGRSLFIPSGYRSYGYNARLYRQVYGRSPTISRHSSGDGVDVDVPPLKKKQRRKFDAQVEKLFRNGGLGRANGFAHVDDRGRRARWHY